MNYATLETGTVEGTGASISISCGFAPRKVTLYNIDGDATLFWLEDMGAGKGYKIIAAGTGALIATLGITVSGNAEASTFRGFIIGADTDVNVDGETIVWEAVA